MDHAGADRRDRRRHPAAAFVRRQQQQKAGDVESTTLVKAGDKAPDFTVEMFGGGKTDLAELKGKVVLLNFWATWCPPCRQELARVQSDVIDRFAGRDFVFLPISRGETHQTVAAFREKTGYTFPMGLDPRRPSTTVMRRTTFRVISSSTATARSCWHR